MTLERLQHNALANLARPRSEPPLWNAPTQPLRRVDTTSLGEHLAELHRRYVLALLLSRSRRAARRGQ